MFMQDQHCYLVLTTQLTFAKKKFRMQLVSYHHIFCCRKLLKQFQQDKAAGRFARTRPLTAAGQMQHMQGFMMQLSEWLNQRSTTKDSATAAYSPDKAERGGRSVDLDTSYAGELASHQQAFAQLEATALTDPAAQPEGVSISPCHQEKLLLPNTFTPQA